MKKFFENLSEAEKIIFSIDHLIYVVFPLVKEKKILLKCLVEIKSAIRNCINSILHYEYLYKRINLCKSAGENFRIFREKSALKFGITREEVSLIIELFNLVDLHNKSSMEIFKDEKIVILSEGMMSEEVSVEKIKEFLNLGKTILEKTKKEILK